MAKVCRTCRFYSNECMRTEGGQSVALCLSPVSMYRGNYNGAWIGCCDHVEGEPIDLKKESKDAAPSK